MLAPHRTIAAAAALQRRSVTQRAAPMSLGDRLFRRCRDETVTASAMSHFNELSALNADWAAAGEATWA